MKLYKLIEKLHTASRDPKDPEVARWDLQNAEITPETDPNDIVIINSNQNILTYKEEDYKIFKTRRLPNNKHRQLAVYTTK